MFVSQVILYERPNCFLFCKSLKLKFVISVTSVTSKGCLCESSTCCHFIIYMRWGASGYNLSSTLSYMWSCRARLLPVAFPQIIPFFKYKWYVSTYFQFDVHTILEVMSVCLGPSRVHKLPGHRRRNSSCNVSNGPVSVSPFDRTFCLVHMGYGTIIQQTVDWSVINRIKQN